MASLPNGFSFRFTRLRGLESQEKSEMASTPMPTREKRALPKKTPLKRFSGLFHVARASFEAGELFQECQRHLADRAIALFGDDELGFPCFFRTGFLVFFINLRPDKQSHEIGVLFDGA